MRIPLPLVFALVCLAAFFQIGNAHALPVVPIAQHMAAQSQWSSFSDSFTVACIAASATAIQPPAPNTGLMSSYTCQNTSATKVAVGDSTIADPSGTQNSPIYCGAAGCGATDWGGNVYVEYCRSPAPVTIYCRAAVNTSSAP